MNIKLDIRVGQVINDYKIIAFLSKGGHGCVFKALKISSSTMVALKFVSDYLISYHNSSNSLASPWQKIRFLAFKIKGLEK